MTSQLQLCHDTYCKISGLNVRYQTYEADWFDFIQHGYTADDVRCLFSFLQRENRRNSFAYSLRLSRYLDREYKNFEELLAMARAREPKVTTDRDKVIQAFRPGNQPEPVKLAEPVKDILRRMVE